MKDFGFEIIKTPHLANPKLTCQLNFNSSIFRQSLSVDMEEEPE